MSFKIAAFNVENLFDRAKAFNESSDEGQKIIKAVAHLNVLFKEPNYTSAHKDKIIELIGETLALNRYNDSSLARIRTIRGKLNKWSNNSSMEIVAKGRDYWIGWAELKTGPVDEIAIDNTGRVIRDVNADILAVVEAENRVVLQQFADHVFARVLSELPVNERPKPYHSFMLIDGNDDRGIDVGIMTKSGFTIGNMRSHINDTLPNGKRIFSRDCPEYAVTTPAGETVWVLPNHFKSKFGGNNKATIAKRKAQATRVAEIYKALINAGENLVVVLGDLNDTPDSAPLKPLLTNTDLRDVSRHSTFDPTPFNVPDSNASSGIGTFLLGNDKQKLDYLLLSPALFGRVTASGMFRKGAWPGVRPVRWPVYESLTNEVHIASDHHVIWATID